MARPILRMGTATELASDLYCRRRILVATNLGTV